jgi:hypothetical protein
LESARFGAIVVKPLMAISALLPDLSVLVIDLYVLPWVVGALKLFLHCLKSRKPISLIAVLEI